MHGGRALGFLSKPVRTVEVPEPSRAPLPATPTRRERDPAPAPRGASRPVPGVVPMRLFSRAPARRTEPEPSPPLDGPVGGVRAWIAAEEASGAVVLRSLVMPHAAWRSATETARCGLGRLPHDAPDERCECGLYAWW